MHIHRPLAGEQLVHLGVGQCDGAPDRGVSDFVAVSSVAFTEPGPTPLAGGTSDAPFIGVWKTRVSDRAGALRRAPISANTQMRNKGSSLG
jgi:hypothetical protein